MQKHEVCGLLTPKGQMVPFSVVRTTVVHPGQERPELAKGDGVDVNDFRATEAGRIVYSPEGYPAFVPAPLPPRLVLTRELAVALSHADAALGRLRGLGDGLEGSAALAAPLLRQEALCSSRIEGVDVSLTEVLLDEIACAPKGSRADHLAEVRNTLATLAYGVECVARVPVDLDLVRSLHARLLRGEPSTARTPGEFRTIQNWIGPPGATATNATYVPPPVPETLELLAQLDSFMGERDRLPDLCSVRWLTPSSSRFTRSSGATADWAAPLWCSSSCRAVACPSPSSTSRRISEAHCREILRAAAARAYEG